MPRILHLIDCSDPRELCWALGPLLARLKHDSWDQHIAATNGRAPQSLGLPDYPVEYIPQRTGLSLLSAPRIRRHVQDRRIALVHTWSLQTAYAAIQACRGEIPVVLTLWDPHLKPSFRSGVRILNLSENIGVLCQAERVRRRLVEHGVELERCAVLRPGVDFSLINQVRRCPLPREKLQLSDDDRVVLLPPAPSRRGGHMHGLWAVDVASRAVGDLQLLVPEESHEARKLVRYARRVGRAHILNTAGQRHSYEKLLGVADVLLVPAIDDVPTTTLAWAMASSVPILASANYCIAEFLADRHNGFLVKPEQFVEMAGKLVELLEDQPLRTRLCETARGQAFESFGMTRYVDQVQHAYENLLNGRVVGQDMSDAALDV